MGTLYVVATPIGNLEDITLRAIRVLGEVSLIAAEDTRKSGRLLKHYAIDVPMTSYFEHNRLAKLDRILGALEQGDVALISDAGTPTISDPGFELVRAALDAGHVVVPIPGPSASIAAVSVSGLPAARYTFLGFLPRRAGERRALLERYVSGPEALLFHEAPHRVRDTVDVLIELFGPDRQLVIARELTKLHEELWRGTLAEAAGHLALVEPRGEYTLVLEGADEEEPRWDDETIERALLRLEADGVTGSRAVRQIARLSGRPRAEVYALWLALRGNEEGE